MIYLFPYMARWHSANRSRYSHLFTALAHAGHRVIVIQPPPRASAETNFIEVAPQEEPRIEVHTVSIPAWLWATRFPLDKFFKKALFTVASFMEVRRWLRSGRVDVMVLYNLPQLMYTWWSRVPVVFDFADDYIAMFQHEMGFDRRTVLTRLMEAMLRINLRRADLVTAVSQPLLDMVHHRRSVLIPNGANQPTTIVPVVSRPRRTVGYVGAFEYFIDLPLILELAQRMPDLRFLLVGAGRDFDGFRAHVKRRSLNNVELTGALPHEQAMDLIDQMDVCLNLFRKGPVSHGASPIKVFEYLARRKPVISTRLDEMLRLDPTGSIILFADDAEECIMTIREALENREHLIRRLDAGADLVSKGHTWPILADQFAEAVRSMITSASDRRPQAESPKR